MKTKAQLGLGTVKAVMIVFLVLSIIAISIFIVLPLMRDVSILVETNSLSSSQSILADNNSAQTLSPIGDGITSNSATAKNNSWLSFDGVDDGVTTFTSTSPFEDDFTLSVWINATSAGELGGGRIFDKSDAGSDTANNGFLLRTVSNALQFTIDDGTIVQAPYTTLKTWRNVVVNVLSNGTATYYIDGVLSVTGNTNATSNITSSTALKIGNRAFDTGATFNGSIDEVRIYNRTLVESEILEINSSGRLTNSSLPSWGLVLWLPLDENTGLDVHSKDVIDL